MLEFCLQHLKKIRDVHRYHAESIQRVVQSLHGHQIFSYKMEKWGKINIFHEQVFDVMVFERFNV